MGSGFAAANRIAMSGGKKILLPQFSVCKAATNRLGQVHTACSEYVLGAVLGQLQAFKREYNEQYEVLKKEQRSLKQELKNAQEEVEKHRATYEKIKQKIIELNEGLQQAQSKREGRDKIRLENELKLAKHDIADSNNYLRGAR